MTQDVNQLLGTAGQDGTLSPTTLQAIDIDDLGAAIQAGLGASVGDVKSSEVTLVTSLIDDSSSIRFAGNADAVRQGHNLMLETVGKSNQARDGGILAHCRYLNGHVLYPYVQVRQATMMDPSNYDPNGNTPLYDQTVVTLATVVAKAQEFNDAGVAARTITLIVTDGADAGSRRQSPSSVAKVVADVLRTEAHVVAAMGVDDHVTDFRAVFRDMGIRDEWILTPGNTPSEILRAFALFSQSAVRVSQAAGSFSQSTVGGFGTP